MRVPAGGRQGDDVAGGGGLPFSVDVPVWTYGLRVSSHQRLQPPMIAVTILGAPPYALSFCGPVNNPGLTQRSSQ